MPLRSKIFLILLSGVVLYAALDYGIQCLIVFPRFIALERDEAVNEGPIRGYVMMGRLLGPDQVKSLCDQTHVNFRLWPINDEIVASQDRDTLEYIRNALCPLAGMVYLLQKGLSRLPVGKMQMAIKEIAEENLDQNRKQDLSDFISLSMERFVNGIDGMNEQLEQMREQTNQIEELLAAQERYAQGKRPVENLKLKDVLNDSIQAN